MKLWERKRGVSLRLVVPFLGAPSTERKHVTAFFVFLVLDLQGARWTRRRMRGRNGHWERRQTMPKLGLRDFLKAHARRVLALLLHKID